MIRRLMPVALLCAASTGAHAELTPEQLLAKMRAAYKAVTTVEMKVQTKFMRAKTLTTESTVFFMAPNRVKIETTGIPGVEGGVFRAVSDGKKFAMVGLPGGALTQPFDREEIVRSLPQLNLETICLWDWERQLSTKKGGNMAWSKLAVKREKIGNVNYYVLEENADRQRVFLRYWVHPEWFIITKCVQYDAGNQDPGFESSLVKLHNRKPLTEKDFAVSSPSAGAGESRRPSSR